MRRAQSILPAQQVRVRAALKELEAIHGSQTAVAQALGVSQQTISRVLNEQARAGVKLALVVAEKRGQTLEELLAGAPPPRLYKDLPGWDDAARAIVEERRAPRYAVAAVGAWPATLEVERVEPRLVLDLASLWLAWTPFDVRATAETAAAEEDMLREQKKIDATVKKPTREGGRKTS